MLQNICIENASGCEDTARRCVDKVKYFCSVNTLTLRNTYNKLKEFKKMSLTQELKLKNDNEHLFGG